MARDGPSHLAQVNPEWPQLAVPIDPLWIRKPHQKNIRSEEWVLWRSGIKWSGNPEKVRYLCKTSFVDEVATSSERSLLGFQVCILEGLGMGGGS